MAVDEEEGDNGGRRKIKGNQHFGNECEKCKIKSQLK